MIERVSKKSYLFALTMGDPSGIGPEITVKAMAKNSEMKNSVVVIGGRSILESTSYALDIKNSFKSIQNIEEFDGRYVNVIDCGEISMKDITIGKSDKQCGLASYRYIEKSIELAIKGEVDGVITNPISKESLHAAGLNYPGHTEIFAERTGTKDFSMVFLLHDVGVAHVTTHCSLRNAIEMVKRNRVFTQIKLLHGAMEKILGIKNPKIAVAGLNPHAGESGLFGDEEIREIIPAIEMARREGLVNVSGPYPPDTVFMRAFKGEFNGVVAMLHDHGFVALKSMDFENGVNITIGLPIIRTSVGHGTAFDIAGKCIASPSSLLAAYEVCKRIYLNSN